MSKFFLVLFFFVATLLPTLADALECYGQSVIQGQMDGWNVTINITNGTFQSTAPRDPDLFGMVNDIVCTPDGNVFVRFTRSDPDKPTCICHSTTNPKSIGTSRINLVGVCVCELSRLFRGALY